MSIKFSLKYIENTPIMNTDRYGNSTELRLPIEHSNLNLLEYSEIIWPKISELEKWWELGICFFLLSIQFVIALLRDNSLYVIYRL